MEEKKYLKWYNKVGYGSGDLAGNVVYAFLSSFVMLYLTNTVGLNPGIIGTLIMLSKLFDGISDMFFGTMIDKTKSRLGKARPWMLYAYIGCAVTLVANFAIPDSLGTTAQYAWFFVAYTLLNAVFCGGSATDLPKQTPEYAKMFNVIDSFDTHARIPEHFDSVDAAAKESGHIGIISVGWDPGMFSLNRLYANAILTNGKDYTFWGKGCHPRHGLSGKKPRGFKHPRLPPCRHIFCRNRTTPCKH